MSKPKQVNIMGYFRNKRHVPKDKTCIFKCNDYILRLISSVCFFVLFFCFVLFCFVLFCFVFFFGVISLVFCLIS